MPALRWSADEFSRLGELAAEGLPADTISERLGRTTGAILSAMHRYDLSIDRYGDAVRDRVLELVAAGWSVSRVCRQHGLEPVAVRRLLAQEGIKESTVARRPTGRLVDDEVSA